MTSRRTRSRRETSVREMTDPRFNDEFWRNEIQAMLQINKKAEQQALAKYGLDYVTDTYLPEKLGPLGLM